MHESIFDDARAHARESMTHSVGGEHCAGKSRKSRATTKVIVESTELKGEN